ncbi:putative spermidine/putrescine transport system substrate-binding protein/spermidine/putrescine transport system substrate-binding protein [Rhizobium sp. RU20A]|uniref:extracellular solute-binding protein n=1 Tax=Rhizobium sp. RU20A TaxID=1907412 RepID=UPI000955BF21|nr:extracellular solute-binding protein [Rhizobium sp. RU20A]SIQ97976.1 putative spermidine/putrescine transport system substrate-binding protein/spermidine/putrescine transport system substrate-binding protein [Rhizobium sp. RU20A]
MTRLSARGVTAALLSTLLLATVLPARAEGLTVFDWSGYEDPSNHPAYTAKYGSEPDFTFFGDEEEAFQKLRSGFAADLAHPCSQSIPRWREAGLIEPLDTAKLTAWKDIEPGIAAMKNLMTSEDGKAWFLPFEWGNSLVLYRSDTVKPEDIPTLKALTEPKFQGRISIGDNVDDAYALASLAIGLKDWTQMTDAQFQEASDFLRALNKNVRMYWTENTDLSQALASGELDVAWGWNETASSLKASGQPVEMLKDTAVGVSTWVCGYVRLKGATADEAHQYDFLNAISDPAVSKYLVETWGYGHGNAKGMAAVPPDVLKAKGYDNVDGFLKNTLFQQPLPTDLRQKMIAEFEKIKAGY